MKKFVRINLSVAAIAACAFLGSCDNGQQREAAMQAQLDSLARVDSLHEDDIKSMADFVTVMSDGIDSIALKEGVLKDLKNNPEGKRVDKAHVKETLQGLSELINRQKTRIASLKKQLANSNSAYSKKIKTLIESYEAQLTEKDAKIQELQTELENKNVNIAKLTEDVNNLTTSNTQLNTTIAEQKTVMQDQDNTIHEAFVVIGDGKSLKSKGLLTGGFLAKKKIDVAKLNASGFEKIDIRNYNNIKLAAKNPVIMTQQPAGSYEIVSNNNGTSTLRIKNIDKFWSVSKYLVIRLK